MSSTMAVSLLLLFPHLLSVYASSSGAPQQPLQLNDHLSSSAQSQAIRELYSVIGDRLITGSPVAKPCYTSTEPESLQCSLVNDFKNNDDWMTNRTGGYFYSNWASCQALGQTCPIPLNTTLEPSNRTCHQGSVSSLVIDIQSMNTVVQDIQAAFRFVNITKWPLVVKNTGHDWKGRSAAPGSLALWTHHLQAPATPITLNRSFTPTGCSGDRRETVIHVGPGQQWEGAYKFANDNNLAVVGGTCGTVGMAGWLQGGGHSPITPMYGMGVDNVRQVEIVIPSNGSVIVANECQNRDMFFAVRGGGGGTFGVVTNITYKAVERFALKAFKFSLNNLDDKLMREYFDVLASNAVDWSRKGWGGYIKSNKTGQTAELVNPDPTVNVTADMAPLVEFLERQDVKRNATTSYSKESWPSWYEYFRINLKDPKNHPAGSSVAVASRLLPSTAFTNGARSDLVEAFMDLYRNDLNMWLMLVAPTKFDHTTTSALHPTWKNATLLVRANDRWDQFYDEATPSAVRAHFAKIHDHFAKIRKLAPNMGVSINEADIWESDQSDAFWGDHYARLLAVKQEVDPQNMLSAWGAVNWDEEDPRYRCYPKQNPEQKTLG